MARSTSDRSGRPERHGLTAGLRGRLAPALACAVALYTTPDPARADDPEQPAERPTLTADQFLERLEAAGPAIRFPFPARTDAALDTSRLLSSAALGLPLAGSASRLDSDFWRMRSTLSPEWDTHGDG